MYYRIFSLLFYNLCLFFSLVVFFFYLLACLLFPNIDGRMKIKTGLVYLLPLNQQLSCEIDSVDETLMILSNNNQFKIWNHFSLKCWELNPDFIEGLEDPCYRAFCLAYINFKSRFIFDNKENNRPSDMSYTYFCSDALRLLTICDHRYIMGNHS